MTDYTELVKALRETATFTKFDDLLSKREQKLESLAFDAADAIEDMSAQLADKDYLIQQQLYEIQRLMADVKRQQEKMFELAKKLPKRGKKYPMRCPNCSTVVGVMEVQDG